MHSICVYCSSANRARREYFTMAQHVGQTLARRGLELVYGGGKTGLMGALADGALAEGGEGHRRHHRRYEYPRIGPPRSDHI